MTDTMTTSTATKPATPGDTLEVTDLDTCIRLLTHWHSEKIAMLEHLMEIPPGTEVECNGLGTRTLSGETHDGFLIGLSVALIELGNLPFVAQVDEEEGAESVAA